MGNVENKVDGMASKVDDAVKIAREAKDGVKLMEVKFGTLQGDVENMRKQITDSKKDMDVWKATPLSDKWKAEIDKKLIDIQNKDITRMKMPTASSGTSPRGTSAQTLVFGGLVQGGDGKKEMDWLAGSMKEMNIGTVDTTYFKGEEFKGMLYARFKIIEAANAAMEVIAKRKLFYEDAEIRCWADAPVEVRAGT